MRIILTAVVAMFSFSVYSQSIEIKYDTVCPRYIGSSFPIGIMFTTKKGKVKPTRGYLKGKKGWMQYDVNVSHGYFKKGRVYITSNPNLIKDHTITVTAEHMNKTGVNHSIDVKLNYKGTTIADYTPPVVVKKFPSVGEIIFNTLLNSASNGTEGIKGDSLNVFVSKMYDPLYSDSLLNIKIRSSLKNMEQVYYIHPNEGEIHIIANGGNGGDGESGDEDKGYGGNGGNGGEGGYVRVLVHENAKSYRSKIAVSNNGGLGGLGGQGSYNGKNGRNGFNGSQPVIEIVNEF